MVARRCHARLPAPFVTAAHVVLALALAAVLVMRIRTHRHCGCGCGCCCLLWWWLWLWLTWQMLRGAKAEVGGGLDSHLSEGV